MTNDLTTTKELIDNIDFDPIRTKLVKETDWDPIQTEQAIDTYKGFLYLSAKFPEKALVPTVAVDEVWHTHILHTQQYVNDCNNIFGAYMHHAPSDPDAPVIEKTLQNDAFSETKQLFLAELGIDIDARDEAICQKNPGCSRPTIEDAAICQKNPGCSRPTIDFAEVNAGDAGSFKARAEDAAICQKHPGYSRPTGTEGVELSA